VAEATDYSLFLTHNADGSSRLELAIDGLVSPDAIATIENALRTTPGLVSARLNFTTRRLTTEWQSGNCNPTSAIETLERLGYRVAPFHDDRSENEESQRTKWLLKCLAVAGFAAINVMLLSISVWAGNVTDITPETRDLFHGLSALIALPAAGFAGQPFYFSAMAALRSGRMNMDVPISIGITLALGMSVYETIHHAEHAYFDSALMLIFFLLAGRVLDHAMRKRTRAAAANLAALRVPVARRLNADGSISDIPSEALIEGDIVLARAGDYLVADGMVLKGSSLIDQSLITGETKKAAVEEGDHVFAGTLNGDSSLEIKVEKAGSATLLSAIEKLIDDAVSAKGAYVQFADRVAEIYAPVVHIAAGLTAMGWIMAGIGAHDALVIAIAVLIITCPCALALAAPSVQVVVTGALFRRGILMKSGHGIERMAAVDTVIFDKTGTLTLPEPALIDAGGLSREGLRLVGQVAQASHHPLARAVRNHAVSLTGPLEWISDVHEKPGEGVEAFIDTKRIRLGSPAFCKIAQPVWQDTHSVIAYRIGEEAGCISVGQALRPDAGATVAALQRDGYRVLILSGDQQSAVRMIADQLEISEYYAGMKPDEKLRVLQRLSDEGRKVLMVGDGLNDAPSLAAAYVSLSPATGADVAQAAADAVFIGSKLRAVRDTLLLCRQGQAVMRHNFVLALVYNLVAVPLAIAGWVTPLIAAAAMSGSSILVTVNALRARTARGVSS
jgi:P-type Cu2+ transporter